MKTINEFMQQGGPFMWIIAAVGIAALAIIIERCIFYFIFNRKDSAQLMNTIEEHLNGQQTELALRSIPKRNNPLNVLLRSALQKSNEGMNSTQVEKHLERVAVKQIPRLTARLNILSLIANISTLAGLLGTIFGLQVSFSSLQLAEGADKASALANGIAQAMNTTAMGLIVAIPCMIAYTQLTNKNNALLNDLDESTMQLLSKLEA